MAVISGRGRRASQGVAGPRALPQMAWLEIPVPRGVSSGIWGKTPPVSELLFPVC